MYLALPCYLTKYQLYRRVYYRMQRKKVETVYASRCFQLADQEEPLVLAGSSTPGRYSDSSPSSFFAETVPNSCGSCFKMFLLNGIETSCA